MASVPTLKRVFSMCAVYNYQMSGKTVNFENKKAEGEAFEGRVIKMFKAAGHEAWKSKDRSYDLKVVLTVPLYGTHTIKAECKQDKVALNTGNIALEVISDGKPSGIHPEGPSPDLWIHGLGNEVWLMKTKAIQSLCVMHQMTWGNKYVPMGDKGMNCQGILMPVSVARKAKGGVWVTLP